jgi:hypothetical protein
MGDGLGVALLFALSVRFALRFAYTTRTGPASCSFVTGSEGDRERQSLCARVRRRPKIFGLAKPLY